MKHLDLRQELRESPGKFWKQKVLAWCFGILSKEPRLDRVWRGFESGEPDSVKLLGHFGFVQLKKSPGRGKSVAKELEEFAREHAGCIRSQLGIYDPDIVVACGLGSRKENTFDLLRSIVFEEKTAPRRIPGGRRYVEIENPGVAQRRFYLVEAYHPAARPGKKVVFEDVVGTYRAITIKHLRRRSK